MEKQIARWSYLLGVGGAVVAMVWRGLTMLRAVPKELTSGGHPLTYDTLLKGALALLVITIATANYAWSQSQKM